MPGMLAGPVRERRKFYNRAFLSGWGDYNARNEGADQIIADPSRSLLNQDELFEAAGGWGTFALTMGLAGAGAAGVLLSRPGMAGHFGRGQLKAMEWAMLGAGTWAGGFIGENLGIQMLGDPLRYDNHWMAYMFVKTQNRYIVGSTLRNTPKFY